MFRGTVRTWPLIFLKVSVCKNSLEDDMHALSRAPSINQSINQKLFVTSELGSEARNAMMFYFTCNHGLILLFCVCFVVWRYTVRYLSRYPSGSIKSNITCQLVTLHRVLLILPYYYRNTNFNKYCRVCFESLNGNENK